MVKNKYYWLILGILLPVLSFSQKKKKDQQYTFLSIPDIVVDGDLSEWEGKFYNADSELWQCALSREGNHIYAAVIVKDPSLLLEAIHRGVILNLSYDTKKKEGARLLFPVADRESVRALQQDPDRDGTDIRADVLKSCRGYFVYGFDKVRDGILSVQNDYGIKAVAKLDSNNILNYEAVISLDLVRFKSDNIAVQLAVNTQYMLMQKVARERNNTMGMYGYGYGMYRPTQPTLKDPYSEKTEIWVTGSIK